ncbi:uncharacterized protein LOC104936394 isoform X1 [Larimichthys crocea]|uniref:uncharacterized protein LOC104936394 isoform X1 n=1 Tax=Larimichthys crocea TaxID=215358 RepID=UPI000900BA15|nr:uncharacterized protein LOC104936394 isoform X1 [Larimichthys crocea]XP_019117543.1 uncharacterized protein LOC104936394 isoform X1 [Larimichthys crocea]
MGSEHQPLSSAESCRSLFIEMPECFICRDVELQASDPLRNFCDCKNLLAHHVCLSAWIQKATVVSKEARLNPAAPINTKQQPEGCESEDRLRCIVCKAKYQLQRSSPWRSVSFRWQTWLVLITALALLGLVPYVVHCMMTTFTNPPPPSSFKLAAASFGLLTEILLIKCVSSFFSSRYRQAEQSSFTIQARDPEEDGASPGLWDRPEAASAAAGHAPSAASPSQVDESKVDVLKSGFFTLF